MHADMGERRGNSFERLESRCDMNAKGHLPRYCVALALSRARMEIRTKLCLQSNPITCFESFAEVCFSVCQDVGVAALRQALGGQGQVKQHNL
jgi:hypothetical protein